MERIGPLLREARHRRGLTQRELARRAQVPQAAISAIEAGKRSPTFDLLERVVRDGRLPLEVRLVDEPPYSAAAFARELRERLSDERCSVARREDGALRTIIDLRDSLLSVSAEELHSLTVDRPVLVGDGRWDAFLAGVVEEVSCLRRAAPPSWTQEPQRFTKPFWYLSESPYFREHAQRDAPAALVRHGVLVAADGLASV